MFDKDFPLSVKRDCSVKKNVMSGEFPRMGKYYVSRHRPSRSASRTMSLRLFMPIFRRVGFVGFDGLDAQAEVGCKLFVTIAERDGAPVMRRARECCWGGWPGLKKHDCKRWREIIIRLMSSSKQRSENNGLN